MHELNRVQKLALYRDGYIVLRNAVPKELTFQARRTINMLIGRYGAQRRYKHTALAAQLPDLINKSDLSPILQKLMGPFDAPTRGFAALLFPTEAQDNPNFGWQPHLDGLWAGKLPETAAEVDDWRSPRTDHFGTGDARARGGNNTPFFQDPACTLALGSFTAFVGVSLNDQSEFGRGNLCLLRGANEHVQEFFREQRRAGEGIGPEGKDWPRLSPVGKNGVTMTPIPLPIRDRFLAEAQEYNGVNYFKPDPILLEEGDAVIALHACPHGGSRNEGSDPRMNVYFRLRRHRPGGATVLGDSDHPDRGWDGEFLDYPEGYDPWKIAVDKLCDHWSEWDGMQEIVAEQTGSQ